jgi:GMP synthase-like glutamine amidotransferase
MKRLNIHIIQHAIFEGPGIIKAWAREQGHTLSYTHIYDSEILPEPCSIDFLVVMGGPMSVYETPKYPWIDAEIKFIRQCIDRTMPVLGICLGAQFLAKALGANVYKGPEKEIGWFPIKFHQKTDGIFPPELNVFHWHGDTFDIPENALPLASSSVVPNQGFVYGQYVFALQFHLEVQESSVVAMVKNCASDLTDGLYIQTKDEIISEKAYYDLNASIMEQILNYLCKRSH